MDTYVCLLFSSRDGVIVRAEIVTGARKAEAIGRANDLLLQTQEAGGYEHFIGKRPTPHFILPDDQQGSSRKHFSGLQFG